MVTTSCTIAATPEQVWSVLSDGWLYPLWVVGATRVRDVDGEWPGEGTQIHHSFGVWPAVIDDLTEVVEASPPNTLRLRARGWPAGEAAVAVHLSVVADGTEVVLEEDVLRGPGTLVPKAMRAPVIRWRNTESLRRLKMITEGRETEASPSGD